MSFELDILHAIQSIKSDTLDVIMMCITRLGDAGWLWILSGVLLVAIPAVGKEKNNKVQLKERRVAGVMVLASLILNLLIVNVVLKNVVARPRPYTIDTTVIPMISCSDFSFPSGHTAASFAAAMALFFYSKKLGILSFVLATVIGFTRMYIFVHFPTDILGGMIAGIVAAIIVNKWVKPYVVNNWGKIAFKSKKEKEE